VMFYGDPRLALGYLGRVALKTPCLDGLSPTAGEKSTSPVITSDPSNFPRHVKVPASRPTLPMRNSTGAEKVTAFAWSFDHFAAKDVGAPHVRARGSISASVAFPSLCASS